jgi:hypothetical protein
MSFTKEFIEEVLSKREAIDVLIEGNTVTLEAGKELTIDCEKIEEVYERVQIKRKYGEYGAHNVNTEAPIRNRVVEFVGKRFVTNEELKNFLTKLEEDRGNAIDQRKWFGRNMRYFESFQNRGQQVWTLSKFGKRVLEQIIKAKSQKQSGSMNESVSNVGLFKF